MQRITDKDLEAAVRRLNIITGSPETPYTKQSDGRFKANIGNYHLSYAYGGVCLHRISNESGGVTTPVGIGHVSKRELYGLLNAFINSILSSQEKLT
jgi:hypothetical protein